MPRKKKEDWSKLSKHEFCVKMTEYIRGEFAKRLADPKECKKIMRRCGYRIDKNGNPYVIPI